jgi:heme exporter protein A
MLDVVDLGCVRGERTLFAHLTLRATAGSCIQIGGANGAGKTSLLRILSGLLEPAAGRVSWDGNDIASLDFAYRADLAWVGHLNGIKDDLDAVENVGLAARLAGRPATTDSAVAAVHRLGLEGRGHLPVRQLSQGQKRRVALARLAVAPHARLWILDEPFNALDAAGVAIIVALIAEQLGRGGIVLLTSHLDVELPEPRQRVDLDTVRAAAP